MAGGVAFAGQAAGIGVAIVFAFLTLMSLLMVAMRAIDELATRGTRQKGGDTDQAGKEPDLSGGPREKASSTQVPAPSVPKRIPEWAIAAVAVYLEAERERERHSAAAWTTHRFGGGR